jgi:hypothetical protein
MKIKEIRMATEADKATIPSGCDNSGNGQDKPPC